MRGALSSLRSLSAAISRWLWAMGIAFFSISLQNQGLFDHSEGNGAAQRVQSGHRWQIYTARLHRGHRLKI
ncbi:unnamed protein product [Linum trigynum]|uniref:Secreted protein n=1 Tax=Linum trigynum TaxID=586398 RepID=A0AAV2ETC6_9ROSI